MSHYLAVTVISLKMQVVVCWKVWTQSKKETHKLLGARTETLGSLSLTTRNQDTTDKLIDVFSDKH